MVRITIQIFRFLIPWLLRVAWFTLIFIGISIASIWTGIPTAVRKIANNQLDRAVAAEFPTELDKAFYFTACIVSFLIFVSGWILTSYLTMLIVRWILRV